jgi:hypothetical protein
MSLRLYAGGAAVGREMGHVWRSPGPLGLKTGEIETSDSSRPITPEKA